MGWQDKLRDELAGLCKGKRVAEIAEEIGVSRSMLYLILAGDREIGSATLEALHLHYPELVARVFLPAGSTIVERGATLVDSPVEYEAEPCP